MQWYDCEHAKKSVLFVSQNLDKLANFDWYLKNHPFQLRCKNSGRDLEVSWCVSVSPQDVIAIASS